MMTIIIVTPVANCFSDIYKLNDITAVGHWLVGTGYTSRNE